jgi:curved DNA-binding protein CbpA
MNKKYYDILQVNRNASPEIIEKAYKTLAKKYHPDLQAEENKKQAEEILKEINEAYEILSVPEKKEKYDAFLLEEEKISQIETITQKTTQPTPSNTILEEELDLKQKHLENLRREQELAYQEQVQQAKQKAYYDAYIQDLKNRGYKIRYKKTFKSYIKDLMALFLTFLILFLLWQIPFVQNFFMDLIKDTKLLSILFN